MSRRRRALSTIPRATESRSPVGGGGSSDSGSSRSSGRDETRTPEIDRAFVDGGCAYLPGGPTSGSGRCRRRRGCESCLDQTQCLVSSTGRCLDKIDSADPKLDFRRVLALAHEDPAALARLHNGSSIPQALQYPAGAATYCRVADSVCQSCVEHWQRHPVAPGAGRSRFCLGDGGCVCIDACAWAPADAMDCEATPRPIGSHIVNANKSQSVNLVWLGASFLVLAVVTFLIHRVARSTEPRTPPPRRTPTPRRDVSEAFGLPILDLTGWKALRQQLLHQEAATLAGEVEPSMNLDAVTATTTTESVTTTSFVDVDRIAIAMPRDVEPTATALIPVAPTPAAP